MIKKTEGLEAALPSRRGRQPAAKLLFAAATALSLLGSPAHAQWAVIDASNLTQNMLTAARTLQQINNQIQSLQNEAVMLENMGKNLGIRQIRLMEGSERPVPESGQQG